MTKTISLAPLITAFILSLFLSGCSVKPSSNYFENKNSFYKKAVHYTKKRDMIHDKKIKAIFYATYLNSTDKRWNNEYENFIVGIYINEEKSEDDYHITLNGREALDALNIKKDHEMYENTPLYNAWAKYKTFRFSKRYGEEDLMLKVSHPIYGQTIMRFEEEY